MSPHTNTDPAWHIGSLKLRHENLLADPSCPKAVINYLADCLEHGRCGYADIQDICDQLRIPTRCSEWSLQDRLDVLIALEERMLALEAAWTVQDRIGAGHYDPV